MTPEQFRQHGHEVVDWIADYWSRIGSLPVRSQVSPGEVRASLPGAAPAGGAQQNFTIVNNTGHTVVTLNVSPSSENSWGPDILGRDTLANGESASITFPHSETACNFDIKATYDDNDTTDARGVNLCQVATVTLTAH